jgi:hypothetical protein
MDAGMHTQKLKPLKRMKPFYPRAEALGIEGLFLEDEEPESVSTIDYTYQSYYLRAIEQQQRGDQLRGLKLVVGPTGLGKTHAIPLVIRDLQARGTPYGCIYTTHRHILLEEMHEKLARADIPAVYLRSNADQVHHFLNAVDLPMLLNDLDQAGVVRGADTTPDHLLHMAQHIQQWTTMMHQDGTMADLRQVMRDAQRSKSAAFIAIFEAGLATMAAKERERWLHDPRIWTLFPYLAFLHQRPRPVLLVTVSKLLHGFFNGQRHQTMTSLHNNLIFLDEFEFQEREVLSFLCQQTGIRDNFEFVRLFYDEMTGLRQRGLLDATAAASSVRQEARDQICTILDQIENPTIKRFQMPDKTLRSLQPI